ncbi:4'-phosphopantetheinyl transferase superfamily protein [Streptomyces sp. ID05-39B]|uniref:4'-phosphopantetheinyl transferase family protein n=1 Tax=Streptomyces sp. ID05-39B TaxID=3028664 RepID=UPI0029A8C723|nr:4'-phosphopantetheinyl transferase superfamily protein [Streptomyces sp. ID05-39B]MDX3528789.1 4'-phosphopantetheinyl transferase superfamily protein [Streptomyces sp. ID05-39B]
MPDSDRDTAVRAGLALLAPAEHDRLARFRFARDRAQYAVGHALLRTALTWCHPDIPPRQWEFRTTWHGRPELAGRTAETGLRFNLSHTPGAAVCVVTRGTDCGIDVEESAAHRTLRLPKVLAPAEAAALARLPADGQADALLRYWTLKEAYTKALGLGLAHPFSRCDFGALPDTGTITMAADAMGQWQFHQWRPGSRHIAALALRRGGGAGLVVVHHGDAPAGSPQTVAT